MDNEKLYFLRGRSQDSCGFLYDGEIIIEGITCPVNVDKLAIDVKNLLSDGEKSGLVYNEYPLKIKILESSYKENARINIAITTVSGKKLTATVDGLIVRHQGVEIILVYVARIHINIIKEE